MTAIEDPRREYWLGYSSVQAILGAQLMPEFLDRYLAENVVSGQQTDVLVAPGRIDNLDAPGPAEMHSAHGRFDDEAKPHAMLFDPTNVRRVVIGAGLALAAAAGAGITVGLRGRRGNERPSARIDRSPGE